MKHLKSAFMVLCAICIVIGVFYNPTNLQAKHAACRDWTSSTTFSYCYERSAGNYCGAVPYLGDCDHFVPEPPF